MASPSLKTIISRLLPLAISTLVTLFLVVLHVILWNSWNISVGEATLKKLFPSIHYQFFIIICITLTFLVFFLAMRYLLIKLLTPFFELLPQRNERGMPLENSRQSDPGKEELHERIKAEEQLCKLTHAAMQCPVSIIITDLQGEIDFVNPHVTKLTGYEPKELLGKNPRILKSGLTSKTTYMNLWETILGGGEWRGELQNRKKNGQLYWERVLISPIRDHDNNITHFIAIKEDISDFKIMENQLRHAQKMESIAQLAGGIAHDFNNILTAIIGYGNILLMKSPVESPLRSTAEQVLAAAERGASLTQGLLTFSRNQANNPLPIDLNAIIQRLENLLLGLIGDKSILNLTLYKLPLMIMADSMQIEQVLINLATNVRDAMPEGCTIAITTEPVVLDTEFASSHGIAQVGSYALLTVSDTGLGMDEAAIKRVFDPFYTTRETGKGTGLGLSIVYGIIKKHNGHIICNSKPGNGTVFYIYLPLNKEYPLATSSASVAAPDKSIGSTILLGDSDKANSAITKGLLEEFGYSVLEAEDPAMLLQIYQKHCNSIKLVILDGIITDVKGAKAFRELKATASINRIVLCGDPLNSTVKQLISLNQDLHFISKPFPPKELLLKVKEVFKDAP
jgi:two-component system NtrC family sensor kinase